MTALLLSTLTTSRKRGLLIYSYLLILPLKFMFYWQKNVSDNSKSVKNKSKSSMLSSWQSHNISQSFCIHFSNLYYKNIIKIYQYLAHLRSTTGSICFTKSTCCSALCIFTWRICLWIYIEYFSLLDTSFIDLIHTINHDKN